MKDTEELVKQAKGTRKLGNFTLVTLESSLPGPAPALYEVCILGDEHPVQTMGSPRWILTKFGKIHPHLSNYNVSSQFVNWFMCLTYLWTATHALSTG